MLDHVGRFVDVVFLDADFFDEVRFPETVGTDELCSHGRGRAKVPQ